MTLSLRPLQDNFSAILSWIQSAEGQAQPPGPHKAPTKRYKELKVLLRRLAGTLSQHFLNPVWLNDRF